MERSKQIRGVCLATVCSLLAAVASTGCDGGPQGSGGTGGTDTGGTGGTGGTAGTTGTAGTAGMTTSSSSSETGNHTFETAEEIMPDSGAIPGVLVDADTTPNFYKFDGKKGDRVVILADAQNLAGTDGDDNTVADPVVTLYDADKNQLARNDDGWPRFGRDSQLFTMLPADGTYFIGVEECNTVFPGGGCAPPEEVVTFDYEIQINHTNMVVAPEFFDTEPNDMADTATATAITFSADMPGQYGTVLVDGVFGAADDQDYFTFGVPTDLMFDPAQRAHLELWVQANTTDGDGSSSDVTIQLIDVMSKEVIAEVDQTNHDTFSPIHMSVPVVVNTMDPTMPWEYFVRFAPKVPASMPDTDFYFGQAYVGSFYYGTYEDELNTGDNGTSATALKLVPPAMITADAVFVDGDLDVEGMDTVDWFSADVPAGNTLAFLYCDAQRVGSGLRSPKFSLSTAAAPDTAIASFTETPDKDGVAQDVAIPAGTTQLLIKVEATMTEPTVLGRYYSCTLVTTPP